MPAKRCELTNQRFGRLLVVSRNRLTPSGWLWNCECECGNAAIVKTGLLTNGNTRSCGCLKREMVAAKNFRHGLTYRDNPSPEYYAYRNAKRRCTNPQDRSYANYGGRGIEFRFESFADFMNALGPRPTPEHSVDRIDNDGHYEAGNIHWATNVEQFNNCRLTRDSLTGRFLTV